MLHIKFFFTFVDNSMIVPVSNKTGSAEKWFSVARVRLCNTMNNLMLMQS